jgi:hypothetical protein
MAFPTYQCWWILHDGTGKVMTVNKSAGFPDADTGYMYAQEDLRIFGDFRPGCAIACRDYKPEIGSYIDLDDE